MGKDRQRLAAIVNQRGLGDQTAGPPFGPTVAWSDDRQTRCSGLQSQSSTEAEKDDCAAVASQPLADRLAAIVLDPFAPCALVLLFGRLCGAFHT